jgi:hypothetical protein
MAGTTGLEPATSAVTGQRSNQLSYVPRFTSCRCFGSDSGPFEPKGYWASKRGDRNKSIRFESDIGATLILYLAFL